MPSKIIAVTRKQIYHIKYGTCWPNVFYSQQTLQTCSIPQSKLYKSNHSVDGKIFVSLLGVIHVIRERVLPRCFLLASLKMIIDLIQPQQHLLILNNFRNLKSESNRVHVIVSQCGVLYCTMKFQRNESCLHTHISYF